MEGLAIREHPSVALTSINHTSIKSTISPIDDGTILAGVLEEYCIKKILWLPDVHVSPREIVASCRAHPLGQIDRAHRQAELTPTP